MQWNLSNPTHQGTKCVGLYRIKDRKSGVKKPSNKNADNDTEQQQQIPFIANHGAAASREIKYNFDIQIWLTELLATLNEYYFADHLPRVLI
jgi:hypothetical protein